MRWYTDEISSLVERYIYNGYDTRRVEADGKLVLEAFNSNCSIVLAYYDKKKDEWIKYTVEPSALSGTKSSDSDNTKGHIIDTESVKEHHRNCIVSIEDFTKICSWCGGYGKSIHKDDFNENRDTCSKCKGDGYITRHFRIFCNVKRSECEWGGDCRYCPDSEEILDYI